MEEIANQAVVAQPSSDDGTTAAGAALSDFAEKAAQQTSLPSDQPLPLSSEDSQHQQSFEETTPRRTGRRGRPPGSSLNSSLNSSLYGTEDSNEEPNKKKQKKVAVPRKPRAKKEEGSNPLLDSQGNPSQEGGNNMNINNNNNNNIVGEDREEPAFEMDDPLDMSMEQEPEKKKGTRSKIVRWTSKEDELLLKIVPTTVISEDNPFFWRSIAKQIPGKTINQCFQHWNRVLNPKIRKGPWSPEEEAELVSYVEKLRGDVRHLWSRVAAMTQGRIDTQCRYQMRIIEKSATTPWEKSEDQFLVNTVQTEEKEQPAPRDWIKLAHKFNNKMARASTRKTPIRSALHVKSRYEYLTGTASELQISAEAAGTSVLPPVDSIQEIAGGNEPKLLMSQAPSTATYRGPVPSKIAQGSYPYSITGAVASPGSVGRLMKSHGTNVVQVAADTIGLRDSNFSQYENTTSNQDVQPFVDQNSYVPDSNPNANRGYPMGGTPYVQHQLHTELPLSYEQQYDGSQQTTQAYDGNVQVEEQHYAGEQQQQTGEYQNPEYSTHQEQEEVSQGQVYDHQQNNVQYEEYQQQPEQ